jgi:peptidoglycan/xylan/chitin deacetylase (PgdA/CDA1 family)
MRLRSGLLTAVICALTWLSACGTPASPTPAPAISTDTPTLLPTDTPFAAVTPTRTSPPTQTPSLTPSFTATPTAVLYADQVPVVEYHYTDFRLDDQVMMTTQWFLDQMNWLAEHNFTTLSDTDLASFLDGGNFPMNSVVLTFDVGTAQRDNFASVIIPALRQHGFKAIFYLLVNESVVRDECGLKENTFCWQELRQWQDEGVVSFGSHGIYHPDYTKQSDADIRYDAGQSKKIIEQKLGNSVIAFTYPYDAFNQRSEALIKALGYQFATAGNSRPDRVVHRQDADRYALPRLYPYSNPGLYPVIGGSGGKTFEQMILGSLAQVPAAVGSATPAPAATAQNQAMINYLEFCRANPQANSTNWSERLDAFAFPTDLSVSAQDQLPGGVKVRPACNFETGNSPRAIVIHYTDGGTLEGAVSTFRSAYGTSAHYIIDRDGTVVQMVPESLVAFHVSCYAYRPNCIASCPICDDLSGRLVEPYTQSIGIELVNNGYVDPATFSGPIYEDYQNAFGKRYWEDYPQAQIDALSVLVKDIRARYKIPWEMVLGHYRINTKGDPGPALNLFWPRVGFPPKEPIFDTTQP